MLFRAFYSGFSDKDLNYEKTMLIILLAAFTDYECAKDEAVIALDTKEFEKANAITTKQWEE